MYLPHSLVVPVTVANKSISQKSFFQLSQIRIVYKLLESLTGYMTADMVSNLFEDITNAIKDYEDFHIELIKALADRALSIEADSGGDTEAQPVVEHGIDLLWEIAINEGMDTKLSADAKELAMEAVVEIIRR